MSMRAASNASNRRISRAGGASQRTTVNLTPEAIEVLERYKNANGISASAAVNQLLLRSEPRPSRLKEVNGFLVLDLPYPEKPITLEDVKQAEDDMDRESYLRSLL